MVTIIYEIVAADVPRSVFHRPDDSGFHVDLEVELLDIAGDHHSAGHVAESEVGGRRRVFARAGAVTHFQNDRVLPGPRQINVDDLELEWILDLGVDTPSSR